MPERDEKQSLQTLQARKVGRQGQARSRRLQLEMMPRSSSSTSCTTHSASRCRWSSASCAWTPTWGASQVLPLAAGAACMLSISAQHSPRSLAGSASSMSLLLWVSQQQDGVLQAWPGAPTDHIVTCGSPAYPGDGLKAVAKATELLLEHMAVKAAAAARGAKRKTVKFSDVERAGAASHASPRPMRCPEPMAAVES
jgi:hypothetical protein